MPRIPIAGTIVEKNNKVLMVRRNFEPNKNKLDLPGGYVEKGETPEQAAVREFKEETGLKIGIIDQLEPVDYFDRQPKTSYTFIGEVVGGKLQNTEEGKPVWIDLNNINPGDLSVPHQFIPIFKFYKKYRSQKLLR